MLRPPNNFSFPYPDAQLIRFRFCFAWRQLGDECRKEIPDKLIKLFTAPDILNKVMLGKICAMTPSPYCATETAEKSAVIGICRYFQIASGCKAGEILNGKIALPMQKAAPAPDNVLPDWRELLV